jgi:hypothetical protein
MREPFFVGAQVPAVSLIDEGADSVLDRLKNDAYVSTIIVPTHGFNPEVIGRATSGADHGISEPDASVGGSFVEPRPEYYQGLLLQETRSPESLYQGFDVLERLLPLAAKRGLGVFAYLLEEASTGGKPLAVPRYPHVLEIDAFGRASQLPCVNHPGYRAWKRALIEDMLKRYPISGVLWGVERQGPLGGTLQGSPPVCFCDHCGAQGLAAGINLREARDGYIALEAFVNSASGSPDSAGRLVSLIRILLENPAILEWEMLWHRRHMSLAAELYGTAKWVNPAVQFGLGIWHLYFVDPILRAAWDLSQWVRFADFLRPIVYHHVAGPRLRRHLETLRRTVLRDGSVEEWLRLWYAVLGIGGPSFSELATRGFGPDYVRNSVEHVAEASGGRTPIYAGIGVDITDPDLPRAMTPADVRGAVVAAVEGGAAGITISRNYAEMRLENLRAVGSALREAGVVLQ